MEEKLRYGNIVGDIRKKNRRREMGHGTLETIAICTCNTYICRPVIERDDGIPDLATLVSRENQALMAA